MSAYLAIRVLLLLALTLTAWWLVRPVSSASSWQNLRRLGMEQSSPAAIVAILVPQPSRRPAQSALVVASVAYGLVIALMHGW